MYIVGGALLYDNGKWWRFSGALPLRAPGRCSQPAPFFLVPLDLCRNKTATRRLNLEQFPQTSRRRFVVPNHPAFPKIIFHNRRVFQVAVGERAFDIHTVAIERHAKGRVEMWNYEVD